MADNTTVELTNTTRQDASHTQKGFYNEEMQASIVQLSRDIIYSAMDGRGEPFAKYFCEGGVFINGLQGRSDCSVAEFLQVSRQTREHKLRIVVTHQSFTVYPQSAETCCVIGNFHLFMSGGTSNQLSFAHPTRVSFNWYIQEKTPRITCLEVSFPIEQSEIFLPEKTDATPQGVGRANPGINDESWGNLVELRDGMHTSHFVSEDDIYYVEARGRKSLVHCLKEDIEVNEGIGQILEALSPNFLRVHRSYLVNAWHVKTVSAEGIVLSDGSIIPIPVRKVVQIKNELAAVRKPQRLSLPDFQRLINQTMSKNPS